MIQWPTLCKGIVDQTFGNKPELNNLSRPPFNSNKQIDKFEQQGGSDISLLCMLENFVICNNFLDHCNSKPNRYKILEGFCWGESMWWRRMRRKVRFHASSLMTTAEAVWPTNRSSRELRRVVLSQPQLNLYLRIYAKCCLVGWISLALNTALTTHKFCDLLGTPPWFCTDTERRASKFY